MTDKKTAHTEAALTAKFKQDNIDETYYPKFIAYYRSCFDELYEDMKDFDDDDFDEGDSIQVSALWVTNEFIKTYLVLIAEGHGEEWSHQMAHTSEEGEGATEDAYSIIKRDNAELAKKELMIHCRALDGDANFEKHYLYLFEIGGQADGRIKKAKNYANFIKEQLSIGKSEVYAYEYATLMASGDLDEIYCNEYAFAYDNAINQNKSIDHAKVYADKYGCAIVNIKRRYGIENEEESIDFAVEQVNAFMHAWEYNQSHTLKDFQRFADIYENMHLNIYFPDDAGRPEGNKEDIDKGILEQALAKFNK